MLTISNMKIEDADSLTLLFEAQGIPFALEANGGEVVLRVRSEANKKQRAVAVKSLTENRYDIMCALFCAESLTDLVARQNKYSKSKVAVLQHQLRKNGMAHWKTPHWQKRFCQYLDSLYGEIFDELNK